MRPAVSLASEVRGQVGHRRRLWPLSPMDRAGHRLSWRGGRYRRKRRRLGRLLICRLRLGLRRWRGSRKSRRRRLLVGRLLRRVLGLRLLIRRLGLRRWSVTLRMRRWHLGLILLRGLLACSSAFHGLSYGGKLAAHDRLRLAAGTSAAVLSIKSKVQLDAGLAAPILNVLAGIKRGSKLLKKRPGNLKVALVIRLIGSSLAGVHPKRSAIGTVRGLLLLRLGVSH
jgi:hypothetical protein